jgi:hypothetical protein
LSFSRIKEEEIAPDLPSSAAESVASLDAHRYKKKREPTVQPVMAIEMSDTPSRREIDAELRAAEARTETRIAQLNSAMEVRASATDHKIDLLIGKIDVLSTVVAEVKADSKVTRNTIWGIGVAVMGLIVALWIAGVNVQANMIAAFQAGLGIRSLPGNPATPSASQTPAAPPK